MSDELGGPITTLMVIGGFIGFATMLIELPLALIFGWEPLLDSRYFFPVAMALWVLGIGLHGAKPEWGF